MIDIKELRIGNEVSYQLNPYKVTGIDPNQVYVYLRNGNDEKHISVKPKYIEPIPLDEKDFIDYGFKKSMIDYSLKVNEIFTFYVVKNEMFYFCPSISIGWSVSMLYVHHLQNIYSSLTGQELTKK